jgi:transcriptional regulator with XRE-family HTH domain
MEESFGAWLRRRRQEENLTLRELAEKLGVTHPYLSQVENGVATPGEELARKAARLFGASEEEVVFAAREVAKLIRDLKETYPHEAPKYFRRVLREGKD